MRSSKSVVVGGLFIFVSLGALLQVGRYCLFAYSPLKPGSPESAIIEVHKGEGPREIAKVLMQNGAIADPVQFVWLGRLTRQFQKIKAGEYKVSPSLSPMDLLGIITSGVSVAHPITIREGENMYEVAADLESKKLTSKKTFLDLCKNPKLIQSLGINPALSPTLEGYLFPETYFFNRSLSAEDMIRQMVKTFHSAWGEKEQTRAQELGMSREQLVILASMVEKETGAPQERPLIASVFYNRLKKKMKLQSDPTTIYGMWARYTGKIHRSDLLEENQYNTYHVPALPAGPIANPGREAIQAVLHPSTSAYLYFVSHNDGTHQFSQTLEQHNQAVRKFQLDPKAREGKSWRDLNKTN